MRRFWLKVLMPVLVSLILSQQVSSQTASISIYDVSGAFYDSVMIGNTLRIGLRYANYTNFGYSISNGFEIASINGASWDSTYGNPERLTFQKYFDLGWCVCPFKGTTADTVGYLMSKIGNTGIPPGWDSLAWSLYVVNVQGTPGVSQICIDSSFFRPGGTWKWVGSGTAGAVIPSWTGQRCFTVKNCFNHRGNVDGDPNDQVDISDLGKMVDYLFFNASLGQYTEEANCNAVGGVDISDLQLLLEYLLFGGTMPDRCP